MSINTTTPNSPGWWAKRLIVELGSRQDRYTRLERYYVGNPDLPQGAQNAQEAYRRFQRKARTNFAGLIVEAVRERMVPLAFRTGSDAGPAVDSPAWDIWQANSLDADCNLVHRAALSMGDAYVIVGAPDPLVGGAPLITPEDPRQVVVEMDPTHRRRPLAALKVFTDDIAQADMLYLFLPGFVFRAVRPRPNPTTTMFAFKTTGFEWDTKNGPNPTPLPAQVGQVVPVVAFKNRESLLGDSMGEFEDVMDVLDRINHMLLQRMVIATMQAFRQRAIKGDLPTTDLDGNTIDYSGMFSADPGALWRLPEGTDMWESQMLDMTSILSGVRHDVQDLAAVTRTPLHYLTPDAANQSAEGASLAREGLVFKTSDRLTQAGESWEQVMQLAMKFAGQSAPSDMEMIWQQVDQPSLAEKYDAASKAAVAGVPWRSIMEAILGFSPQQIEQMAKDRIEDLLLLVPKPEKTTPKDLTGPDNVPPAEF